MKVALPLALIAIASLARADEPRYPRRWVWAMSNLMVDKEADRIVGLVERAAKDGYNGLVLADYKMNLLDRVQPNYFPNAARVLAAAKKAGVEVIPAIVPIGYSNGLLSHDTNLAEGLPVEGAPFLVTGREARLVPDPSPAFTAGDMEKARGDAISGFGYQDEPGKASFADHAVKHGGNTSLRIESTPGNCRLIQGLNVRPHSAYRLSAWVKTEGWTTPGNFRLMAIGDGGRSLSFVEGGVERTQDWKLVEVVFNSLDFARVNLYAGIYGGGSGKLWIDDLRVEAMGLVNVLRRDGCPLVVASDDGKILYEEGKDFEPVSDPQLGRVPYAGEYGFGHEAPPIRLTADSRIKDGSALRVSWYHPVSTVSGQVMCCPSEPKVYDILRDQIRRVNSVYRPRTVVMSHDEIRVMNWCRACRSRKLSPGQILADNVRRCTALVNAEVPGAEVLVWSDMFDPHHNAVDDYYLVNGSLKDSWEGLSREVGILNWNGGKAAESLKFFADRGHTQVIAGFYDVSDLSGFTTWDAARKDVPRVDGFMYTTWGRNYGLMEQYGKAMR